VLACTSRCVTRPHDVLPGMCAAHAEHVQRHTMQPMRAEKAWRSPAGTLPRRIDPVHERPVPGSGLRWSDRVSVPPSLTIPWLGASATNSRDRSPFAWLSRLLKTPRLLPEERGRLNPPAEKPSPAHRLSGLIPARATLSPKSGGRSPGIIVSGKVLGGAATPCLERMGIMLLVATFSGESTPE